MDQTRTATALAASAALLAAVAGADEQALRASLERAGGRSAGEFDEFLAHLRDDPDKGRVAALQALHPVKGDAEAASQVMEALIEATGDPRDLAPAQVAEARGICETLNLSPTRFNL